MESTNWAPEHSQALRELLAKGTSFSEAADTINAKFGTWYTRNATIGRAKRMGMADSDRQQPALPGAVRPEPEKMPERHASEFRTSEFRWPLRPPVFQCVAPAKLRCVEVDPRRLSLLELECNDCRYPYGGNVEGEAITFCGHPRRKGSSYCTAHFRLTSDPVVPAELTVNTARLRLVRAT